MTPKRQARTSVIWMWFPRGFRRILNIITPSGKPKTRAGVNRLGLKGGISVWASDNRTAIKENEKKKKKKSIWYSYISVVSPTVACRRSRWEPLVTSPVWAGTQSQAETHFSVQQQLFRHHQVSIPQEHLFRVLEDWLMGHCWPLLLLWMEPSEAGNLTYSSRRPQTLNYRV